MRSTERFPFVHQHVDELIDEQIKIQLSALIIIPHFGANLYQPHKASGSRSKVQMCVFVHHSTRHFVAVVRDHPNASLNSARSEEHTSALQSLIRHSYAVF